MSTYNAVTDVSADTDLRKRRLSDYAKENLGYMKRRYNRDAEETRIVVYRIVRDGEVVDSWFGKGEGRVIPRRYVRNAPPYKIPNKLKIKQM